MNPGLVVKLRPSGPWRIGPDSGARNRVDVIYHSDSLFSAVTSAMARMGRLEEWLDATARSATPAVCFSSCFPFVDEIGFVIPPRTVWPPSVPSTMAGRVRWKSARFIPLAMVQSILSGERVADDRWSLDGPSGCLMPAGRQGPFRTSVRWSAAVDRLSGASERQSTACIEFRPGAGLWTVIGFADAAARDRWQDAVKAAFRLLADSGFGGERSRGWGRSEAPEFIEGELPEMILAGPQEAHVAAPAMVEPLVKEQALPPAPEILAATVPAETAAPELQSEASAGESPSAEPAVRETPAPLAASEGPADPPVEEASSDTSTDPGVIEVPASEDPPPTPPVEEPPAAPEPPVGDPQPDPEEPVPPVSEPVPVSAKPAGRGRAHWILSLFAPSPSDTVDWARGSYTVLSRGGRIESPAGSGDLKKQIQMVAEGSVLVADSVPCGSAPDVAPDGFAHPVFRAGFALAIPLPEGH